MIPIALQDEIEERMRKTFSDTRLRNPDNQYVPLNIFKQHLPEKDSNDISHFPYMIIKLLEGEQTDESLPQNAQIVFIVGVFDDQNTYQGYRDVANILQKIYQDLKRNPLVNNRFELSLPIKWAIHDEDTYPYYFGGVETNWDIPSAVREDLEEMI